MKLASEEFWNDSIGKNTLLRISDRGTEYWSQNVYKYYNRGSGKLGDACQITLEDRTIVVSMKPLYSIEHGKLREYGQDLRNGIPAGPGKYSPLKGYRLKVGQYPGVPVAKFWEPWMTEFEPVITNIVREEVLAGMRDFIREQILQGATT